MLHALLTLFTSAFTEDRSLLLLCAPFLMAPIGIACTWLECAFPVGYSTGRRAVDASGVAVAVLATVLLTAGCYGILTALMAAGIA